MVAYLVVAALGLIMSPTPVVVTRTSGISMAAKKEESKVGTPPRSLCQCAQLRGALCGKKGFPRCATPTTPLHPSCRAGSSATGSPDRASPSSPTGAASCSPHVRSTPVGAQVFENCLRPTHRQINRQADRDYRFPSSPSARALSHAPYSDGLPTCLTAHSPTQVGWVHPRGHG